MLAKEATTFVTIDLDCDHVEITQRSCVVVLIQAIGCFFRRLALDHVQLTFF